MTNSVRSKSRDGGFALIEALVALLVMAFGMLSLVGMQTMLSRNADAAKQIAEAQRLAQEKLECLRAYTKIDADTTVSATRNCMGALRAVDTWADMATATDPGNPLTSTFSNAKYSRSWELGAASTAPMRPITVRVDWTDRAGVTQTYRLSSVISQSNPDDSGDLGFPLPQNTNLKRPKNRNLNIPVPAVDLGGGKSAYQINSTLAVVFSNDSGYVIQKCNTLVTAANYATLVAATTGDRCTNYSAYVIAGYISGDSGWTSTVAGILPTGINTASITGVDTSNGQTVSCAYSPATQVTNQNVTVNPPAVAGVWRYYLCVIPVTAGGTWSGTIRLAGMETTNAAAVNNTSRWSVCRFQYAASTLFPNDNERNLQPYSSVSTSLDSQNYFISSSGSCPVRTVVTGNGPSQQSISVATTLHQNCMTSNSVANRAMDCPTAVTGP